MTHIHIYTYTRLFIDPSIYLHIYICMYVFTHINFSLSPFTRCQRQPQRQHLCEAPQRHSRSSKTPPCRRYPRFFGAREIRAHCRAPLWQVPTRRFPGKQYRGRRRGGSQNALPLSKRQMPTHRWPPSCLRAWWCTWGGAHVSKETLKCGKRLM